MKNKKHLYYLFAFGGFLTTASLVFLLQSYQHGFFKKTATGLQYRVVSQGKGSGPQENDMLLFDIDYKTEKGLVLFSTTDEELPMALPYTKDAAQKNGGIEEAIGMLQKKGDSFIFKLSAEKIFGESLDAMAAQYEFKKNENILLHLQLQDIMSQEVYKKWETEQIATLQKRQQEKVAIQHQQDAEAIISYLKEHKIVAQTTPSGLYYVVDTPGQGAQPKQGDKVKVNYTGKLLNGKVFDTSLSEVAKQHKIHNPQRTYEAIAFQLGVGQVIQGWDEGIMCLRQGAKARLFIPSTMAYGSREVGNGLIPPNAILVFDIELVDVQG